MEVFFMKKINIGLSGLIIIIFLNIYQNFKILEFKNNLEVELENLNLLIEDIHNDVHELIE